MARVAKPKLTFDDKVKIPTPRDMNEWVIVGIDPSLSRTGLAVMTNTVDGPKWELIKSLKPADSSYPVWVRSVMMADFITTSILAHADSEKGLIISLEAPTPGNDWLNIVNKIIQSKVLPSVTHAFKEVCVMHINAMTLRSCLGLVEKGNNKHENIRKAHEYANAIEYPGIDSDACDAVLLGQFGRHASDLFLGQDIKTMPEKVMLALCDFSDVVKGKGRNQKIIKKGILYNPNYWFKYETKTYSISIKDARIPPKKRLEKLEVNI
jgi:hypothetical protein